MLLVMDNAVDEWFSLTNQLESADNFLRNAVDVFEDAHNSVLTIVFPLLGRGTARQTLR